MCHVCVYNVFPCIIVQTNEISNGAQFVKAFSIMMGLNQLAHDSLPPFQPIPAPNAVMPVMHSYMLFNSRTPCASATAHAAMNRIPTATPME